MRGVHLRIQVTREWPLRPAAEFRSQQKLRSGRELSANCRLLDVRVYLIDVVSRALLLSDNVLSLQCTDCFFRAMPQKLHGVAQVEIFFRLPIANLSIYIGATTIFDYIKKIFLASMAALGFLGLASNMLELNSQLLIWIDAWKTTTRPFWELVLGFLPWTAPDYVKDYLTMGVISVGMGARAIFNTYQPKSHAEHLSTLMLQAQQKGEAKADDADDLPEPGKLSRIVQYTGFGLYICLMLSSFSLYLIFWPFIWIYLISLTYVNGLKYFKAKRLGLSEKDFEEDEQVYRSGEILRPDFKPVVAAFEAAIAVLVLILISYLITI